MRTTTTGTGAGSRARDAIDPGPEMATAWATVRRTGVGFYLAAHALAFFTAGMIIDRISVTISVAVLLVIANLGRPWPAWRLLALDLALYVAMWTAYDETRGLADRLGSPLQVNSVILIDRNLFLGADPNVWMQDRFYSADVVRWYDVAASVVYFSHFIVPVFTITVLWIVNRPEWVRLMRRTATVLGLACMGYIAFPTAPPWMAAGGDTTIRLASLPYLARPAGRGWSHLGLDSFVRSWETGRDWVNTTAAMPSLHGALALLVVVWLWPLVPVRVLRPLLVLYPLSMLLSLVYLAEHYVVDVVAGWAAVGLSFLLWNRIEAVRAEAVPDVIPR